MIKNLILIGRTGSGKSTLANVITDTNKFRESGGSTSTTKEIQSEKFGEGDSEYQIIDTVGIGDTQLSGEEILDRIAEAIYLTRNGISRILFVTECKFDKYETASYNLLRRIIFDDNITKHTTIVRTKFDGFKNKTKCQKDIELMTKNSSKLNEIINSCGSKVVHTSNPPIDDDEEELEFNKKDRNESRKILLEHLKQCCQDIYQPQKLKELSKDIVVYMERKNNKTEQFIKKAKDLNINLDENNKVEEITNQVNQLSLEGKLSKNIEQKGEELSKIYEKGPKNQITELIKEIKELKEIKKLKIEIEECEKGVRRVIYQHIFNDIEAIKNLPGGEIFISIIEDYNNPNKPNKNINDLDQERKAKQVRLKSKKGNELSLTRIEEEITKKEKDLTKLKELLNWESIHPDFTNKELILKWLSNDFDYQQTQRWFSALGGDFNPEKDASFCAWLRDTKQLTTKKIQELDYPQNIEELRGEYTEQLELEKKKKYTLTKENFLKLIQLTFSVEVVQANQAEAQASVQAWVQARAQANQASVQAWVQAWVQANQALAQEYQARAQANQVWVQVFQALAQKCQAQAEAQAFQAAAQTFQARVQAYQALSQANQASVQAWVQAFQAEAQAFQAAAQTFQATAQALQTHAQHLKINLTLENIEKFFIEVKEEAEERKVEISVSIENKPKKG